MSVKVGGAVDKSNDSLDLGPLQATCSWVTLTANNVIDCMVEADLGAPVTPGGYESMVLDQTVINLVAPNNLAFTDPVHCRVLLSSAIETTTVGNTIVISKGLIGSLPSEEAIASVAVMERAYIVLDHHIDNRYAFNARLIFPDEATFQSIDMYNSEHDNIEASKKAEEYLQGSMYNKNLPSAGYYWAQLADRGRVSRALNTPKLGDSLLRADGTPWMGDLARSAVKLNWEDLSEIVALPLGSLLKTDPWDDKVHMLNGKRYAPMNARDKMPLEVTPLFYRL